LKYFKSPRLEFRYRSEVDQTVLIYMVVLLDLARARFYRMVSNGINNDVCKRQICEERDNSPVSPTMSASTTIRTSPFVVLFEPSRANEYKAKFPIGEIEKKRIELFGIDRRSATLDQLETATIEWQLIRV
jgi:hypothetical protein